MNLRLVGLSHKTAPLDVRERLHVGSDDLPRALVTLKSIPEVRECFILSTCNRVEVFADLEQVRDGSGILADFLCHYNGQRAEEIRPHLYSFEASDAIAHLFRVASSLDSMVVGEPQIVGQVRDALREARDAGTIGPVLGPVLDRALAVAKRVRTQTGIARNAVSISYAAAQLARTIFGELHDRRVLVLGAGEMSKLAARHLVKLGVGAVLVANRSPAQGKQLAASLGGSSISWENAFEALVEADIVIASTASTEPVVGVDTVRRILPRRRYRPMFFIDIAVPRDIEPQVNGLDNVYLYDIDDLQAVVAENLVARSHEAERAEILIDDEVARYTSVLSAREVAPTIAELRDAAERVRREVVARVKGDLGGLTAQQEEAIEAMTRGLINKLLHNPVSELKRAAQEGEGYEALRLVRRLYRLDG